MRRGEREKKRDIRGGGEGGSGQTVLRKVKYLGPFYGHVYLLLRENVIMSSLGWTGKVKVKIGSKI